MKLVELYITSCEECPYYDAVPTPMCMSLELPILDETTILENCPLPNY